MPKKETLHNFDDDFPNWYDGKQKKIGDNVYVKVENIIGGNQLRSKDYWIDWNMKIPDMRYKGIERLIIEKGMANAGKTINKLGFIDLFRFKKGNKYIYYVVSDGHRRVALAHKFNVKTIKAEVWEIVL